MRLGRSASGQLGSYALERGVGIGADRRNRRQADDDDQGEHHRVFNGSRAIFGPEKATKFRSETLHNSLQSFAAQGRHGPGTTEE